MALFGSGSLAPQSTTATRRWTPWPDEITHQSVIKMDPNMKHDSKVPLRPALARLRKTDTAFAGKTKDQPVIVYRHGRWHMITVGFVVDLQWRTKPGISAVNFMSAYRARKTISEWWPYSQLIPFEEVCPTFREELASKVLPQAEDYRSLLERGLVEIAGGHTTDTLQAARYDARIGDRLIAIIDAMMKEGQAGPFLHFGRSYEVILGREE